MGKGGSLSVTIMSKQSLRTSEFLPYSARVSAQQKKPEREALPPFLAIMFNNVSKLYPASDVGVSS